MSKYNEINQKLATLTEKHRTELTPTLILLEDGNIHKSYRLTGSPWHCNQLIEEADVLGYTNHAQNGYEIAQDCAYYEPEEEEAETISEVLESDRSWDDIMNIITDIIKDYDFDEESYYIREAYTPNGDQFYDVFELFDELSDFEDWIDDHISKELFLYTQNVYENFRSAEEVKEWNLLPDLANWANYLLETAGSEYHYNPAEWISDLVEEWEKTDETTY